jgi:SWI/SNF-related matrix-associated actin-dependent regulator 1 of chromatin subfamily A
MKRCILLTGCNLIKKPHELYGIMKIIRYDLMPSFYEFGYRYCDPRQSFEGIDFSNAGNMYELKKMLEIRIQSINKRRGNQEELPNRMRQKVEVFADVQMVVKM